MTQFNISPRKQKELLELMAKLEITENDIEESFIRGSGKGGQKINKTASCVRLVHKPSGIEVKCQEYRSQSLNRFIARRLLCEKVEEKINRIKSTKQQKIEKIRRQKRKRSKRQKEKMLEKKRIVGTQKELRHPIRSDDLND